MPQSADEKRLGEMLVSTGKLSREDLQAAVEAQRRLDGPDHKHLGEILVDRGHLSASEFAETQAAVPTGLRQGDEHFADAMSSEGGDALLAPDVRSAREDPKQRIGDYIKLEEIGRGGMGVVFRCYDPSLRRYVAIKVLLETSGASGEDLARFKLEARATAKIRHPGIVSVHEVGEHRGYPFLVMDFVEGKTLAQILSQEVMSQQRVLEIMCEVAQSMDKVHKTGILHRDLKPQNIMIDTQGQPIIMDFGLARDQTARQQLTQTGEIMGTPSYMSPEQADDSAGRLGPWTDVYALGAILYRSLTGRPPFQSKNLHVLLRQVLMEPPVPLHELNPDIHPRLEAIVLKCLAKDTPNRYQSAGFLVKALRNSQLELASTVVEISRPGRLPDLEGAGASRGALAEGEAVPSLPRGRGLLLSAVAALVGALVAVGGVIGWQDREQQFERKLREAVAIARKDERRRAQEHLESIGGGSHARLQSDQQSIPRDESRLNTLSQQQIGGESVSSSINQEPGVASSEAMGWYDRGSARKAKGDLNGAIAAFDRAIAINPKFVWAWNDRGNARWDKGDVDGAIDDYSRALDIDPNCKKAWNNRGLPRKAKGDLDGAIADYTRAIELDPSFAGAFYNRGVALYGKNDFDGAIADFQRFLELAPDHHYAPVIRRRLKKLRLQGAKPEAGSDN